MSLLGRLQAAATPEFRVRSWDDPVGLARHLRLRQKHAESGKSGQLQRVTSHDPFQPVGHGTGMAAMGVSAVAVTRGISGCQKRQLLTVRFHPHVSPCPYHVIWANINNHGTALYSLTSTSKWNNDAYLELASSSSCLDSSLSCLSASLAPILTSSSSSCRWVLIASIPCS